MIAQQYTIYEDVEKALRVASDIIAQKYRQRGHPFADTDFILRTIDDAIPNPLKIRWPYAVTLRPPPPFEESPDSQVAPSVEPPSS